MTESVTVANRRAYLALPVATKANPGPWPAVVVVQDAFGLSDDMREQADWLAAASYIALVPDLYDNQNMVKCVKSVFGQLAARTGVVFDQIEAARTWLGNHELSNNKVGVIGYCLGGGFALVLAGRPGWSAASVNYGRVPDDINELLKGACPVVASYGAKDKSIKGGAAKVEAALEANGVVGDVKEYPEAGHGFINRVAVKSPLATMMKVSGVGYNHAASTDAKRRILSFFDTHLAS